MSRNNLFLDDDVWVELLAWQLTDYSYTAISSTELPVVPPDLSVWPYNDLAISGGRGGIPPCFDETFHIGAEVTSVWLVPEPATLFLFGLSGLLLRKHPLRC